MTTILHMRRASAKALCVDVEEAEEARALDLRAAPGYRPKQQTMGHSALSSLVAPDVFPHALEDAKPR